MPFHFELYSLSKIKSVHRDYPSEFSIFMNSKQTDGIRSFWKWNQNIYKKGLHRHFKWWNRHVCVLELTVSLFVQFSMNAISFAPIARNPVWMKRAELSNINRVLKKKKKKNRVLLLVCLFRISVFNGQIHYSEDSNNGCGYFQIILKLWFFFFELWIFTFELCNTHWESIGCSIWFVQKQIDYFFFCCCYVLTILAQDIEMNRLKWLTEIKVNLLAPNRERITTKLNKIIPKQQQKI